MKLYSGFIAAVILSAGVVSAQQPTPEPYAPPAVNTAPAPRASSSIGAGSMTTGKPQAGSLTIGKPAAGSLTSGRPAAGSSTTGVPQSGSSVSGTGAGSLSTPVGERIQRDSASRRGRRSGRTGDDDTSGTRIRTRARSER